MKILFLACYGKGIVSIAVLMGVCAGSARLFCPIKALLINATCQSFGLLPLGYARAVPFAADFAVATQCDERVN